MLDGDKIPLNDVWIYNTSIKLWSEVRINYGDAFDARFCHSATLVGDKIYVYGGKITLFNL